MKIKHAQLQLFMGVLSSLIMGNKEEGVSISKEKLVLRTFVGKRRVFYYQRTKKNIFQFSIINLLCIFFLFVF